MRPERHLTGVELHFPGRMTSDLRTSVTLHEAGTPWPLKFHFLRISDNETGEFLELRNVGFEIGDEYPTEPGASQWHDDPETPPVDPQTVRRIGEAYATWVELARLHLIIDKEGMENAVRKLRGPGQKPGRLTDEFYRLISDEFRAHDGGHAGKEIAAKYNVHPGTVSKWRKECIRRELLLEEES